MSTSPTPDARSGFSEPGPAGAARPFGELLDALAERSPAPAGGCAAGWAGALAAALLQMAAAFADDDAIVHRASELRNELLSAAQDDLESYPPVLEAMRRPADDPDRERALRAALDRANEAPLAIARAAAEVANLAATVAERSKPALRGDADTAATLAEAARRAAERLVELNAS